MIELNKLSKEQLIDLAKHLLTFHEGHYNRIEKVRSELNYDDKDAELFNRELSGAFYQYAGNVQAIRQEFNLPKLYNK